MIKENELALCHCENVSEARQYGSKHELSAVAKVMPEAQQYAPSPLEGEGWGEGFKKRTAFTLAEVLITLGIIGVVAAMTIPTLIQKHEEKVTVVKVKKMYSTLSQAYLMNKAKDEIVLQQTQSDNAQAAIEVANVFLPYLKITKDCGTTQSGCMFSGTYKYYNGEAQAKYDVNGAYSAYRVMLSDGSSIWFRRSYTGNSTGSRTYADTIFYDANGPKAPNIWGKDVFYFQVVNDVVLPMGDSNTLYPRYCADGSTSGLGCTAWIIKFDNMDYLHCNNLNWTTKTSCN